MPKLVEMTLAPAEAYSDYLIRKTAARILNTGWKDIAHIQLLKRAVDARRGHIQVLVTANIYMADEPLENPVTIQYNYHNVEKRPPVIVVGCGPAGIFAALRLIELGYKPIVLEQGKKVHQRKIDIATLNRNEGLKPLSNYCFGEGGAGAFSDGKLYTRSKKKESMQRVTEILYLHGAAPEVLFEAHAHIGSDKLPLIVENMVKTVTDNGGELHFETKVEDLIIKNKKIGGCITSDGKEYIANALILATGHSARQVYEMLQRNNIALEAKGFAMGVRVEHPQTLINNIQFGENAKYMPPATYNVVTQSFERGVYSFCMCPGGHIVPAASDKEQIVVNGMSSAKRNSPYANSGIVVEIRPEDLPYDFQRFGALAGLKFQQHLERLAYNNNGARGLTAPAQRMIDFVRSRLSDTLPESSYLPGLVSSPLHFWLPEMISKRLQDGFRQFGTKIGGFLTNTAVVVGVESRTSSPVRIPRVKETLQHIEIEGLFPCGEGAGYAGGITSSAIDGEYAAEKVAEFL